MLRFPKVRRNARGVARALACLTLARLGGAMGAKRDAPRLLGESGARGGLCVRASHARHFPDGTRKGFSLGVGVAGMSRGGFMTENALA